MLTALMDVGELVQNLAEHIDVLQLYISRPFPAREHFWGWNADARNHACVKAFSHSDTATFVALFSQITLLSREKPTTMAAPNDSHADGRNSDEEARYSNEEKGAFLLPIVQHEELEKLHPVPAGLSRRFWISTAVNTICTALIVRSSSLL